MVEEIAALKELANAGVPVGGLVAAWLLFKAASIMRDLDRRVTRLEIDNALRKGTRDELATGPSL